MIRKLVKIANKLDSLGLTKEADILDAYAVKLAAGTELVQQDIGFKPTGDVSKEDAVAYDIANNLMQSDSSLPEQDFKGAFKNLWISHPNAPTSQYASEIGDSPDADRAWTAVADKYADKMWKQYGLSVSSPAPPAKKTVPTNWTEYVFALGNAADAASVRQAWEFYARDSGGDPSFAAFVAWWKGAKKAGKFVKGGGVAEVVAVLSSGRVSAATPVAGGAQATFAPVIPQGVRSGGGDFRDAPFMNPQTEALNQGYKATGKF